MTDTEKKEVLHRVEKPCYRSKKWLAWFIQQLLMASMAITALVKQPELGWSLASFMVGIVFMMGISTMWYLGKQAAVDTAVRGFAMVGKVSGVLSSKVPFTKGGVGPDPDAEETNDG